MSSFESSVAKFGAAILDGSERFVANQVHGEERQIQQRFICVLLSAPFLLALCWLAVAAGEMAGSAVVASVLAGFVFSWSTIALVAIGAPTKTVANLALGVSTALIGWTIAALGGLASPALLLALVLPVEAWWIFRTRSAIRVGILAGLATIVAQPLLDAAIAGPAASFTGWHWLLPAAYGALALPRIAWLFGESRDQAGSAGHDSLEDLIDAVVLRFVGAGDIIDVGGKCEELLGVKTPFLLGAGLFERINVGDRVAYLQALSGLGEGQTRSLRVRVRLPVDDSGHPSWRMFQLEIHGGSPGLIVLRDDMTVQDMQSQIDHLRDQLTEGEIAKARFLATVSHELRTPLNAIIGFADMLSFGLAGPLSDPRQTEYAKIIRDSGGHLLSVVNAILDISRIESRAYAINCEPFSFSEAAASCHAMLSMQAKEKSVELRNDVLPAIGEVNGDRRAVQQVLINLLSNAIKFTPKGGSVSLSARKLGRYLVFDVSDTGIGIAEDDLARLGKPFVQVRCDYAREQDGVGLGLSIAKGLVALHGGAMTISSAPGAGTTVSVKLPLVGPAAIVQPQLTIEQEDLADATFRKSA